jgi:hypothetical protein
MPRRESITDVAIRTAITSAAGSAASALALMALGAKEGTGSLRPISASGHWLYGSKAGRKNRPGLAKTVVGFGTHHAATMFRSFLMETWLGSKPRTLPAMAITGASTGLIAAAVDYALIPRSLSPGWELALTRKSIAGAFAAMAAGMAAGAFAVRSGPAMRARKQAGDA